MSDGFQSADLLNTCCTNLGSGKTNVAGSWDVVEEQHGAYPLQELMLMKKRKYWLMETA